MGTTGCDLVKSRVAPAESGGLLLPILQLLPSQTQTPILELRLVACFSPFSKPPNPYSKPHCRAEIGDLLLAIFQDPPTPKSEAQSTSRFRSSNKAECVHYKDTRIQGWMLALQTYSALTGYEVYNAKIQQ